MSSVGCGESNWANAGESVDRSGRFCRMGARFGLSCTGEKLSKSVWYAFT